MIAQQEAHLDETLYTRTRDIVKYVKETFGVAYSISGGQAIVAGAVSATGGAFAGGDHDSAQ